MTESTVESSFRKLFRDSEWSDDTFEKAEALLDELRCESPLRHRLSRELEELRALAESKQ